VPADGSCILGQQQEGRLTDILRVVLVMQHTLAHAQEHEPMPAYDFGKSRFIPLRAEPLQ
jgi:hypothetical protein